MIFDRPSTRTRVSFDVGMRQLGGELITLTSLEMQLGRGETIADTARVLSRYVDVIMIRTPDHEEVVELAQHATVPVINGLTRRSHPVPGDRGCHDLRGASRTDQGPHRGLDRRLQQRAGVLDARRGRASSSSSGSQRRPNSSRRSGCSIGSSNRGRRSASERDPEEAVKGADCVVTDTWVSMDDKDGSRRHNLLKRYQVNARLMAKAKPDALFMHCLPAHRGDEVTDGGHGRPAIGRVRRGGESPARPERHSGLVPACRHAMS